MPGPLDDLLGQLALEHGFVTRDQLDAALRRQEAATPRPPLGILLVEAGLLTQAQVDRLLAEQDAAGATLLRSEAGRDVPAVSPTLLQPAGGATPAAASAPPGGGDSAAPHAPEDKRRRCGKYELVGELGRGGMGVVYKAWHPGLKSYFAVKVLLAGSDASAEDLRRFEREAQAAARLKHPGILAVHDLGVEDGKTWFAMEYVAGASLDQVLQEPARFGLTPGRSGGLGVATAVRMAREVAEALHAAHAAGVVHRDLKPANVLRDATGRLKVMDFGLAKLVDAAATAAPGAAGATRTGTLMGTPAYMSPEQARGAAHEVDARSDVYQVGALLYELLTGHPPYEGKDAIDVVLKVLNEDPRPPRRWDPSLDRDAETICLKALAREKARRYASAQDLAQDCRRLLEGEAILARRAAWWETPLRWARRRKALVGVGAAAALALAVAGGQAWRAHTAMDEVLLHVRTIAASNLESALMVRRAGGRMSEIEQKLLPPLEAAVRRALERAPGLVEPHYHLGRMYRALMRFDDALKAQQAALAQDADYGPSLYERGVLRSAQLRRLRTEKRAELSQLRTSATGRDGAVPATPRDEEVEAAYPQVAEVRRGALADLMRAAGQWESQPGMKARACAARGVAALLAGSAEAERLLAEALKEDAQLEEVHAALAEGAALRGDWAEAARRCEEGWRGDLGYVPYVVWLGESLRQAALAEESRGGDGGGFRRRGRQALEEALGRDPAQAELWGVLATLRLAEGFALRARGQDPAEEYRRALEACDRALALNPNLATAVTDRAHACQALGDAMGARGADPADEYRKALAGYQRALALNPNSAVAANNQALVFQSLGDAKYARGVDPTEEYRQALASYERALALHPGFAEAASNQANVFAALGDAKMARGQDPTDEYRKALAGFERALALDPNSANAANSQALVWHSLGDRKRARGEDPTHEYRKALAGYERAVALNPKLYLAVNNLGTAYRSLGDTRRARGEDPTAEYEKALAGFDRALALNPGYAESANNRANVYAALGETKRARGEDATDEYRKALVAYDRALALKPNYAEAAMNQAHAYQLMGDEKRARGEDPAAEYGQALAGYDRALALNPNLAEGANNRAGVYTLLGDAKRRRGEDPRDEYRAALAGYERALQINPRLWQAHANRGPLLEFFGAPAEAVRAYEAALALGGAAASACQASLVQARAAAAAAAGPGAGPPAAAPAWRSLATRAAQAVAAGDYAAARPLYEEALAAAAAAESAGSAGSAAASAMDPASRAALRDANYDLACILALAAAGRDGPKADPKPVAAGAAARERDAAFEHLRAAVALGYRDRVHFENDSDLAPLRTDPRWAELLGKLPEAQPK